MEKIDFYEVFLKKYKDKCHPPNPKKYIFITSLRINKNVFQKKVKELMEEREKLWKN